MHQEKKGTMNQLGQDYFYKHPVHTEYGCDENGNVYSFKRGAIRKIKPTSHGQGYLYFTVYSDGNMVVQSSVHRFVWECIKGEIPTGYHVDHLDFDRENNCIDNLLARPAKENIVRQSEEGMRRRTEEVKKARSKPVLQLDIKTGEVIKKWDSAAEANRQTGIHFSHISDCCRGKRKTAGGFIWKYKPNDKISNYE